MKPLCHQIANLADVLVFQDALSRNGYFDATLPLVNPNATWPVAGDMIAIHGKDSNVTLMAFVRRVVPGLRDPAERFPRINVTAGYRLRAFTQARLPAPTAP